MASSRKRQEDKNLKILRELVNQPENKKCFDCGQRGPTYVNMMIGAFVCTSCSGLLRGLNPPHRIKSISMASFNQQEIEFLQKHGNEVCRNTWLAQWDAKIPANESREEQKVKDYMVQKYERKVWYSDQKQNIQPVTVVEPVARPLKTLLGNNSQQVYVSTEATQKATSLTNISITQSITTTFNPVQDVVKQERNYNMDLLGNFGNDPFSQTTQHPTDQSSFGTFQEPPPSQNQQPFFDAFTSSEDTRKQDSFDFFAKRSSSQQMSNTDFLPNSNSPSSIGNTGVDKYAALAELDMHKTQSVFSGTSVFGNQPITGASSQPNPFMSPGTSSSGAAVFQQQQQKPVNPFQNSSTFVGTQNANMFQQAEQNSVDLQSQAGSYSWAMPNASMNLNNVAAGSHLPSTCAIASTQQNRNFLFGALPQTDAEFVAQGNLQGRYPGQQSQGLGFTSQHNVLFPNPQVFGNTQPSSHGSQNQLRFGSTAQHQLGGHEHSDFSNQQFHTGFKNQNEPTSQTLFPIQQQQQFVSLAQPQQYNHPIENFAANQNQQTFAAAFSQQLPENAAIKPLGTNQMTEILQLQQQQSSFGFPTQLPYKQPVKSTNPFM